MRLLAAYLGFPGVGGIMTRGVADYVRIRQQPTALPEASDPRLAALESVLLGAGSLSSGSLTWMGGSPTTLLSSPSFFDKTLAAVLAMDWLFMAGHISSP